MYSSIKVFYKLISRSQAAGKIFFYLSIGFFLLGVLSTNHLVNAQEELVKIDKDSESYQDLIRRNFEMRKELKALESNYEGLENERKVLLLHVKQLQETRDDRLKVIQDLKNMIASLRIEMLKDPKLTKTIDLLNERAKQAEKEKSQLQQKADQLDTDKRDLENEITKLKKSLEQKTDEYEQARIKEKTLIKQSSKKYQQLQDELKRMTQEKGSLFTKLTTAQDSLGKAQVSLAQEQKVNKNLVKKLKTTQMLVNSADEAMKNEKRYAAENKQLVKEFKKAQSLVDETEKKFQKQIKAIEQENKTLTKKSAKVDVEKQSLEKSIKQLKEEINANQQLTKKLLADIENEKEEFQAVEKTLKKERLKYSFEQEYYEQEIKNARADRAIFEAKASEGQKRAQIAEQELQAVKDELASILDKNLLRESEVALLQEEKVQLEEKLVKYVEKLINQKSDKQSFLADNTKQPPVDVRRSITKKELAQKKLNMHYNMALAYNKRGMYKKEEREYRQCLRINPNDANVHYNLAILYDDKLHKNKKAVVHYKKFLALNPSGEDTHQVKKWILHAEQDQRLSE